MNLLLGTDVLPHSLLCATSTICRLHNSSTKRFEIITREGEIIPIEAKGDGPEAENELKEKLKPYVSIPETHKEHMYKQVEIYWPIPMLQVCGYIHIWGSVYQIFHTLNTVFHFVMSIRVFSYNRQRCNTLF